MKHIRPALAAALCATLCAALLAGCASAPDAPKKSAAAPDLVIAHANDTHAYIAGLNEKGVYCTDAAACTGGYARMAAEITRLRAQYPGRVLALHAGDSFQGTLFFSVHRWPMLAELDALMPWDAATPGNHEFDEGCEALAHYIAQLPFPMLAANLQHIEGTPLAGAHIAPYAVRDVGGHKVGVIGLANDSSDTIRLRCPGLRFPDHEQALRAAVKALQAQGVQRIVALTHLGLPEDRRLARSVDGLDAIIGGHSHTYLGAGSSDGPYPIVEHSPNGDPVLVATAGVATRWLGELAITFDAHGVPVKWSGQAVPLAPAMPRDATLDAKVASYADALAYLRADRLGSHSTHMNDGLEGCRLAECFSALLLTDAMLEWGRARGAHIAFTNSGNVRAPILPGAITRGDVLAAFPFADRIWLRALSGAQVLEALEHGVRGSNAGGAHMLQAAGLRYTVDAAAPPGQRVIRAEILDAQGRAQPLDPAARYIVVLSEYLALGGDGFDVFLRGAHIPAPAPLDAGLLADYIRRHSPLPSPATGRLTILHQQ